MNVKRTMLCLTLASVIGVSSLFAAETKIDSVAPLSISGQVDAYFKANSNKVSSSKTSYTNQQGFGLGMVVDILCGLLSGMPFGREITSMYQTPLDQKRYLGQFYMALDIAKFQDVNVFKSRLRKYMDEIRCEPAKDPAKPVLVPGDPEKTAFQNRSREGIPLSAVEFGSIAESCRTHGVKFP